MASAPASRQRMTREEALRRQEQKKRIEEKRRESYELSRGPIDLPFCFLVLSYIKYGTGFAECVLVFSGVGWSGIIKMR